MKRFLAVGLFVVLATAYGAQPHGSQLAAAAAPTPPPNALEILWNDYCARTTAPECVAASASPTPAPTSTASPSASPTPSGSPPSPSASATSTPSATPTPPIGASPSPTTAPTAAPPSGVIGAAPASGSGPLVCPAGYINWESRGWWTPTGQPFDQYRGIDAEICWPTNEFLAPGTTTFKLHIQLRRLHAPIRFIRIGYGPDGAVNGFYQDVNLAPDAAGYGEWYLDAPLKANTHAGYNEYRLTANVPSDGEPNHLRHYQSTGLQAWTTSSNSSYRSRPWWESRGWYETSGYVNVRLFQVPPSGPVSGNWSIKWACAPTGPAASYHVIYVDANTHAIPMVLPHVYGEGNGGFNGTTTIDTTALANGPHKLILRCDGRDSQGTTSALTQVLFSVAN